MNDGERQEVQKKVFHLFGGVGKDEGDGFTLSSIVNEMSPILKGDYRQRNSLKPVFLISSRGGSNVEALRIYAYLSCLPLDIITAGVGLVESAATIVYLAGKKRLATASTVFLFHEAVISLDCRKIPL